MALTAYSCNQRLGTGDFMLIVHIEVSLAVKLRVNTFSLINHLSEKSHITYILFIHINMYFLIVSVGAHKIQQLRWGDN